MSYEPQRFAAPDGTAMVILTAADYDALRVLADEGEDAAAGAAALARVRGGEGTMPAAVLASILDDGLSPLAAWRKHRGLSQAALAAKAGLSQVWVGRIEAGGGHGSPATRRKLAAALGCGEWGLENDSMAGSVRRDAITGKGAKYRRLCDHLQKSSQDQVTMRYDDVARLVGGLPKSASLHRAWWANHQGNSQAQGWLPADYLAEPDMARRTVVFRHFSH